MPFALRIPRRTAPLVTGAILALAGLQVSVAPAAAVPAGELVTVANGYRAAAGVAAVAMHTAVQQIASERANHMASTGDFSHDFDYVADRLAQEGVCWQAYGEIIAWHSGTPSPDYDRFGAQWYASDVHRGIMIGSQYTAAGGGVGSGNGRHYAAMIFVRTCGSAAPSIAGFSDVGASAFAGDIAWLAESGITAGCAPGRFCPKALVTRGQMASFLARALDLPTASRDHFTDDESSPHEGDINRLADAGVTGGCTATRYCPGSPVTRAQMASLLARALDLAGSNRDWFGDDAGLAHEWNINRLAAGGVTGGCSANRYCPHAGTTREHMAAFLHRAFGP